MTSDGAGGAIKTSAGRVRLGWRLLAFLLITVVVWLGLAAFLPISIPTNAAAMLSGAVVASALVLAWDGRELGALGFYLGRSSIPESLKGLGLGIVVGLAVVAMIAALGGLRWSAQEGSLWGWLVAGWGAMAFLAIPAAAEEALLRGYPLQALAEAWGPLWALAVTSIAFGGLHAWNPEVTPLALANVAAAGVLLGVVYLKTGSLWWATGVHLGWNWSHGFLADVPVSGLELLDAPFYEGVPGGVEWIGGGAFGPEGSVVATVLVLGASVALWKSDWLGPEPAALARDPLTPLAPIATT